MTMVQSAWLLMVLSLVPGPGRGNAEETFTFKIKASNKGDRSQVDKQATDQSTMQLEDSQGNTVQAKEETKAEKFVYQETILEKPAGQARAARLRRHYDLAEAKTGDDRRTLPYQGKTGVISKKGDRYRFQIDGGEEI